MKSYIQLRGNTYHFRYRVPAHLKTIVGKTELTQSLRTDDQLTAMLLARQLIDDFNNTYNNSVTKPLVKATPPKAAIQPSTVVTKPSGITLEQLVKKYSDYQITVKKSWSAATALDNAASYNLMIKFFTDIDASTIDRAAALEYQATVLKLPANLTKKYGAQSIDQILSQNPVAMNARTADKHMIRASSLFKWSVDNQLVTSNPFAGLSISKQRLADDVTDRLSYTSTDLTNIFHGLKNVQDDYKWIITLLATTGARSAEITGLRVQDVRQMSCKLQSDLVISHDVFGQTCTVLDINTAGKRRLKNASAERIIPLHKSIEQDFLKYVDTIKKDGHEYLFPNLRWSDKKGNWSNSRQVSDWYNNNFKKHVGIVTDGVKKDLHSFRHTVADRYKTVSNSVPSHVIQYLLGHHQGTLDITFKRYGSTYDITVLKQAVDAIDVSFINYMSK